jgi:hypothetical protein
MLGVVVLVVPAIVVQVQRRTFKPPGNARTLAELKKAGEPVQRLVRVDQDGHAYYLWLGASRWSTLPSGPACFVFNERGQLEQYTASTGDMELGGLCDAAWAEPKVSLDDAIESVGQQ